MADIRASGTGATLDAAKAIAIYMAKARHTARDMMSAKLAAEHGITMKAVRDVWNLRTWAWTTMPYWSDEDIQRFLSKHLCRSCRRNGVQSIATACRACAGPRRRGRRPPYSGLYEGGEEDHILNRETNILEPAPADPVLVPDTLRTATNSAATCNEVVVPTTSLYRDHSYNHGNTRSPQWGGENEYHQVLHPAQHDHPHAMATWNMDAYVADAEANTATEQDDQNMKTVVHDSTWLLYQQVYAKLGCYFDSQYTYVPSSSSSPSSSVTSSSEPTPTHGIVMASGPAAIPWQHRSNFGQPQNDGNM